MNNTTSDQASSARLADPELEELLGDAFEAPSVPRSLLKRIDRAVEQEWGTSPRLSDTRTTRVTRSLGRGARRVKTLPIAAALSVFVALAVTFLPQGSAGYGWADLVEALREQTMVLIEMSDEARWMAPEEGVVASSDQESSDLLNLKEGYRWNRVNGEQQIRRQAVSVSGNQADKMVLALLLGRTGNPPSHEFLKNAVITDEQSETVSIAGEDRVALKVKVESSGFAPVSLRLIIDPGTQLPITCSVRGSAEIDETLAFSYSTEASSKRVAASFPADLPVVSFDAIDTPKADVALNTAIKTSPDLAAVESPDTVVRDDTSVTPLKPDVVAVESVVEPPKSLEDISPPDWPAVNVVQRSSEQVTNAIDDVLAKLWKEHSVQPAKPASEEELLRRVYLDLAGRTPGVNEVRTYLHDTSPQRYEALVDRLLSGGDHATHLATTFRTFLISDSVDLTKFGGVEAFDKWLAERFRSGVAYDEIVSSLLLAEGRLSQSGPLLFYSAAKLDPDQLAAKTARVFLGTRLECAQCHDHPFEAWTQEDFWGFAAFFARISRPKGTIETASTVLPVIDVDHGDVMMPDTENVVPPKFLNASAPLTDEDPTARRRLLAEWLTSGQNPYFARATANRVWAQLFGKGLVEPLDDFGTEHPAKSVELLDLLASHLINSGFDLRELFRSVVLSDAYQLSSGAATEDDERLAWFGQMNVKTLTAEQVYDCITVATLLSPESASDPYSLNVVNRFGNTSRAAFLQQFRTPVGRQTEYQGGIPQALTLMNGSLIDGATGLSTSGLLKSLEAPFFTNEQRIEVLYFATLSRRPTPREWELLRNYIDEDASDVQLREGLSDILWALLNSAEFTMNH